MDIASSDLIHVRDLYSQGQYCGALEAANVFGPLRSWNGTPARLLGGRLAIQLGAPEYGRAYEERIPITRRILTDLGILD